MQTIRDRYPVPRIDDLMEQLSKAKVFSIIDLARAYNQIRMDPSFQDCSLPVLLQIHKYSKTPFRCLVQGQLHTVYLNIIYTKYDMPEANQLAGQKVPTSNHGCRFGLIARESFGDMEIVPRDLAMAACSNCASSTSRLQATQAATDSERSHELQEVSLLQEMSIYVRARLPFNPHRQLPVDGSHANASGLFKDRFLVV